MSLNTRLGIGGICTIKVELNEKNPPDGQYMLVDIRGQGNYAN